MKYLNISILKTTPCHKFTSYMNKYINYVLPLDLIEIQRNWFYSITFRRISFVRYVCFTKLSFVCHIPINTRRHRRRPCLKWSLVTHNPKHQTKRTNASQEIVIFSWCANYPNAIIFSITFHDIANCIYQGILVYIMHIYVDINTRTTWATSENMNSSEVVESFMTEINIHKKHQTHESKRETGGSHANVM